MADGADVVGRQGDVFEMRVSVPTDEDGFFGRQCTGCSQVFRVDSDEYKALPEDLRLWCVYCGHHDEHSEFMTQQQRDRVMRAVGDLGVQLVGKMLGDSFGRLSRPRSQPGSGVEISFRSKPFYPQPLPGINEERLVRVRQCGKCTLRYAVFGEHRFCPVCGPLPVGVVTLDALAAELARLDLLDEVSGEAAAALRERGVFSRIRVDTLENLVGLAENLARNVFHAAVADAVHRVRGKGNVFQRLDDTAELFADAGYADLRSVLDPPIWRRLQEVWAIRHLFTHHDGVVDDKYLAKVPGSPFRRGQRVTVSVGLCRQAIADTEVLCIAVIDLSRLGSDHGPNSNCDKTFGPGSGTDESCSMSTCRLDRTQPKRRPASSARSSMACSWPSRHGGNPRTRRRSLYVA